MRAFCLLAMLTVATTTLAGRDQPNIVFMLSDDQSWGGTSVAMHPDHDFSRSNIIQTPSLERLAAAGMRFSAAYAPASVCSPTRCSLQLGMSPALTGWTKAAPVVRATDGYRLIPPQVSKSLSRKTVTIAELLQDAGYATAHFGKWHLNGGGPTQHGYHEGDGATGNEVAFRFADPNPVDIFGMAERASAFMKQSRDAQQPFFVQLSWHALHAPENALRSTIAKYAKLTERRVPAVAAISEDLDTGVGMVMDSIEELGLSQNTYVIYMSDNGGGGRQGQLRGGKGTVYEGGIRSPLIIRGPSVAVNSWCHSRVVGHDLFPTFCDWAGIPTTRRPRQIEGGSLAPILAKGGLGIVNRPREELVFHFPHYQSADGPQTAIFVGDMKLIHFYDRDRLALFDLATDIQERYDLASQRPTDAKRLYERLELYLESVGARLPQPNPEFDAINAPSVVKRASPQRSSNVERERSHRPVGERRLRRPQRPRAPQ